MYLYIKAWICIYTCTKMTKMNTEQNLVRVAKEKFCWHKRKVDKYRTHCSYVFHIMSFWNFLLCLLCLATTLLEPDLTSMQNKYTRGWYNCILCVITVSGWWYSYFCSDLAFFRVDCYIYNTCYINGCHVSQ